MFGGIAFLRDGLMLVGVLDTALVARVGKADRADLLRRRHVRPMDFTGKPMQGCVFADAAGVKATAQLGFWLDRCERLLATLPPKAARSS